MSVDEMSYQVDLEVFQATAQGPTMAVADTIYIGLSGQIQGGPAYFGWNWGIAIDDSLNVAVAAGPAYGGGVGARAAIGVQVQTSNARYVNDLGGPFSNASVGGGLGPYASYDHFWGPSDNGMVVGRGFTFGAGVGGGISTGRSQTYITPLTGRPFYNTDYLAR
jgi:hypothetical protein